MRLADRARERWERMAVREQRLLLLLGATFVVGVVLTTFVVVQRGLSRLGARNEEIRSALHLMDAQRETYVASQAQTADPVNLIGAEAIPLLTYLESSASEAGIQIPESREGDPGKGERFTERSVEIKVRGITLDQLGHFLEKVETKSPVVVVTRLLVKRPFNEKEKLDLEATVATFEKAEKDKKKPGAKTKLKGGEQ